MRTFSYRSGNYPNVGTIEKTGLETMVYRVAYADGVPSSVTVSTITAVALNAGNGTVTSLCIGTLSVSGTTASVTLLTCGTSGAAASDGERFRIRTTAVLSDSSDLVFDTFVKINDPTYAPG